MSEEKISEILTGFRESGLNNIGKLMGEFNKNYKGQAESSVVSKIAKEVLES
jgi:uncharacterized protein YqeY